MPEAAITHYPVCHAELAATHHPPTIRFVMLSRQLLGSVAEFGFQRIGLTVAMRTVAMKDTRAGGIIRMLTMP